MHLVRYASVDHSTAVGALTDDGTVVDVGYADMVAFIAGGEAALARARAAIDAAEPVPLPNPGKMLFLGRSYARYRGNVPDDEPPFVYSRVSSSIIGPGEGIRLPRPDVKILYEGEMLIVIGRAARGVSAAEAMSHVFGYTQVNDVTWVDWLPSPIESGLPQICLSKNADTFCPMGPYIATADEYEGGAVPFTVSVNGEVRTTASTEQLVWKLPRLIEFLSRDMTLWPGDVIATGTPDAQDLVAGDEVTVEFEGLGQLTNPVVGSG